METGQAIAIVDIGEASTEASISLCDDAQLKVLVKDSEKIGGADFDRAVIEHIIQQLAISNPDDALRSQVRLAWLKAKFEWEDEKATNIEVGNHKTVHLDRATFKALNTNNLTKVKHFVRHIASSKITEEKDRVDTVALLGGSSQIPEIVSIVEDAFDRKILNKYVLLSFRSLGRHLFVLFAAQRGLQLVKVLLLVLQSRRRIYLTTTKMFPCFWTLHLAA